MESAAAPRVPDKPEPPAPIAPSVARFSERFLDHCRVAKGLSANTLRAYRQDLTDFAAHVGAATPVSEVGREAIRSYASALLEDRHLKETTIRRRLATLKVLFRWLEREDVVPLSVFHRLDLSIRLPKRLPRALPANEMRSLLLMTESGLRARSAAVRYEALLMHFAVVTLFTTGLRISELVDVRLTDVDAREGVMQVRGKGNRERRVYLPGRQAIELLKIFMAERRPLKATTDHLLVTADGKAVTTGFVRRRLKALGDRAGVVRRITPHMLRHTAATQLLEAGVDIRLVQRLLGHASIATTQIYTQVTDVALKARLTLANTLVRIRRGGRQ